MTPAHHGRGQQLVVGYPPLSELSDQRAEFHVALLARLDGAEDDTDLKVEGLQAIEGLPHVFEAMARKVAGPRTQDEPACRDAPCANGVGGGDGGRLPRPGERAAQWQWGDASRRRRRVMRLLPLLFLGAASWAFVAMLAGLIALDAMMAAVGAAGFAVFGSAAYLLDRYTGHGGGLR